MSSPARNYLPVRDDWLAMGPEPALDASLPIVDAHHHFFDRPTWTYLAADYLQDLQSGHNIVASVYMQALTRYRPDGAELFKPVGETEFVTAVAESMAPGQACVAQGIVGHVDLRAGSEVKGVLEAHIAAGRGRFKGVRHLTGQGLLRIRQWLEMRSTDSLPAPQQTSAKHCSKGRPAGSTDSTELHQPGAWGGPTPRLSYPTETP